MHLFFHILHFPETTFDNFSKLQIARFEELSSYLFDHLDYKPIRHLLNSSGIERFAKEAQYDMARLGIGLYGVSGIDNKLLKPTAYLRAPVLQVKTILPGETVGYSRAGVVKDSPVRIATVAIGYADGVDRHLSRGKGYFSVNGHKAPIFGNVCMDMCMIDVTDIHVQPGDMVTVFGDSPTISELAEILGTISHEILTLHITYVTVKPSF